MLIVDRIRFIAENDHSTETVVLGLIMMSCLTLNTSSKSDTVIILTLFNEIIWTAI